MGNSIFCLLTVRGAIGSATFSSVVLVAAKDVLCQVFLYIQAQEHDPEAAEQSLVVAAAACSLQALREDMKQQVFTWGRNNQVMIRV